MNAGSSTYISQKNYGILAIFFLTHLFMTRFMIVPGIMIILSTTLMVIEGHFFLSYSYISMKASIIKVTVYFSLIKSTGKSLLAKNIIVPVKILYFNEFLHY